MVGTGAIAPLQSANGQFYCDIAADANGAVSGTIYSTRDATGALGGDISVGGSTTAVYYTMFIYNNGVAGPGTKIHAKNGATLDPSSVTPITTPPVVSAPTGDGTYARLDGGNTPFTGQVDFTAGLIAKTISNVRFADQYSGSDAGAKIQAAHDDLPSAGGVVDARGIIGTQTSAAAVTFSKPCHVLFGEITLTVSGHIHITGNNVCLQGLGTALTTLQMADDGTTTSRSLWVDGSSGVTIRDMTVSQSGVGGRTGVYGTVRLGSTTVGTYTNNVRLLNLNIPAGSSTGVFGMQVNDLVADAITISSTEADGFHLTRGCTNCRLSSLYIHDTGDDGLSFISIHDDGGTAYSPNSRISVSGAVIVNSGTGAAGRGLAIYGGHDISISGVVVDSPINDGIMVNAVQGAVSGTSTFYPYHINISDCTVYNSGSGASATEGHGVSLSFCRDVTVSDTSVFKTGTSGHGFSVSQAAQDVKLIGCTASKMAGSGFKISQTTTNEARILSELWTNLGFTAPSAFGINDVTISSPIVDICGADGIGVFGTSQHIARVNISAPDVSGMPSGSTNRGIVFSQADYCTVTGGSVVVSAGTAPCVKFSSCSFGNVAGVSMNTTGDGADIVAGTSCGVIGCNITGAGVVGLFIDNTGGASNYFSGNTFSGTWSINTTLNQDSTSIRGFNFGDTSPGDTLGIKVVNPIKSTSTLTLGAATPTVSASQLGIGTTAGFGNGTASTAMTTTTKGTGSGPATAQTVVNYLKVNIGGTDYWIPLMQ